MSTRWLLPLLPLVMTFVARADGPADNQIAKVRPVPPPGIKVADDDRKALQEGVDALGKQIESVRASLKGKPDLMAALPDVQIYEKAVRWALAHNEFYNVREVAAARKLLEQGRTRAGQLGRGQDALERGDRVGRSRLCLADRRVSPAVWPGRAGLVPTKFAPSVPARCLVPRTRGEPERAELLEWTTVVAG